MAAATKEKILTRAEAAELADEAGLLRARMSPLESRYTEIQKTLCDYLGGAGNVDGDFFHVNIASQTRNTVDVKAAIEKLGEYMQPRWLKNWLDKNTKSTTFPVMRVTALLKDK